jgi:single-strand DNA-binding protein
LNGGRDLTQIATPPDLSRVNNKPNGGEKMSGSLNKVTLIGNLGADPEIRTMQGSGRVASFSIATSESWKDKDSGEKQEKKQWHKIVIFNEGLIKLAESYLRKGSKVYLEGQLETRKWQDDNGVDRYATEVVLRLAQRGYSEARVVQP